MGAHPIVSAMMIRVFTPNDVYKVADITHESLREAYPISFFLTVSQYWPEGFLVAVDEGEIVGFVMGVMSGVRQSRILMLAIRERHRRIGTASTLIRSFTSSSMLKGADSVILEVRVSNGPAINLYNKLGFKTISSLRAYYRDGEDGYRMQLILQN
jgi:ribosomal-protein-alanine N-acetyltransferase